MFYFPIYLLFSICLLWYRVLPSFDSSLPFLSCLWMSLSKLILLLNVLSSIWNSPKHYIIIIQLEVRAYLLWQYGIALFISRHCTITNQSLLTLECSVEWVPSAKFLRILLLDLWDFPFTWELFLAFWIFHSVLITP